MKLGMHAYSTGRGTQLPGSEILNFGPCAARQRWPTPIGVLVSIWLLNGSNKSSATYRYSQKGISNTKNWRNYCCQNENHNNLLYSSTETKRCSLPETRVYESIRLAPSCDASRAPATLQLSYRPNRVPAEMISSRRASCSDLAAHTHETAAV